MPKFCQKNAILFVLCLLFAGCATPLYQSPDRVSIFLHSEPEVLEDSYKIKFRFESPTQDPHLIQWIEVNGYHGVEAFRITPPYQSQVDTHFTEDTTQQLRRITIAPGEVEGVDATFWGFSMLPSNWPPEFNAAYRAKHKIQGHVVYRRPEHETIYHLDFVDGVLRWWVEGTDVKREWRAKGK